MIENNNNNLNNYYDVISNNWFNDVFINPTIIEDIIKDIKIKMSILNWLLSIMIQREDLFIQLFTVKTKDMILIPTVVLLLFIYIHLYDIIYMVRSYSKKAFF